MNTIILIYTELVDQGTKASGKERNDCFHTYMAGTTKTLCVVETGQEDENKLVEWYIFLPKRLQVKFLNKEEENNNYGVSLCSY